MDQRASTAGLAEVAIRSAAAMVNLQIGIAHQMAAIQARNATVFGVPDYSEALNASAEGTKRLCGVTTDRMLEAAQRITGTMDELQRQFARTWEQQARTMTEEMCRGVDSVGEKTAEVLRGTEQIVAKGAREIERSAESRRANSPLRSDDPSSAETLARRSSVPTR